MNAPLPPRSIDRREFVRRSLAVPAALAVPALAVPPLARNGGGTEAAGARSSEPSLEPSFEISLAQWSLHRALQGRTGEKLDNLDFAAKARSFGIGAVEYVNSFFKDKARDEAYLGEMRRRAGDEGVESLLIMCDGEGRLGDPDGEARAKAVENHHRWVDAARFLGCHSIRVNAASEGTREEQSKLAADGLARLTGYGAEQEINVIVENHGGLSSDGSWLAGVIRRVNHPRCGTLPDFGNFHLGGGKWYDRYEGVEQLMPFAKAVSAKSHQFDDAGNETKTDYRRMMTIVLDAGYHGFVGIEYEGGQHSEEEGIRLTRVLLERVRDGVTEPGLSPPPAAGGGDKPGSVTPVR